WAGADGDLRDVDVAVRHGDLAEVLLADRLAAGRELGDGRAWCGLRCLAAGVAVDLGVEDQHVDVAAARHDVVEASEPDVVRPAVAAAVPDLAIGQRLDEGDQPCRGAALVVADVDVELLLPEALPERDEALALRRDAIVVSRAYPTRDAVCQVL